jgi:predicted transcriptional regulator
MKLQTYIKREKLTPEAFGDLIGVSRQAVDRYVEGRVPETEVMRKIILATKGRVRPNDFFSDTIAAVA